MVGHRREVVRLRNGRHTQEGQQLPRSGRDPLPESSPIPPQPSKWSDSFYNRMLRWDEATGAVTVFRRPSIDADGHTRDRQDRLVSCEHLTRRVTRTEHDGSIAVLADRFDGRPLNAPNDVVVALDGSVWFTDPGYRILSALHVRSL